MSEAHDQAPTDCDSMRESFWLISMERRIQLPEVRAVLEDARSAVFVPHGGGEAAR